ncbi:hypothetical protein KP509_25G041300 [Ceratopteris richardii]|uniref:Cytochrome P450 n=1 Tax=Ceratopteris richardii TaxID=49495 RepID=A0A8T2RPQ1_CERRI|nr:hypothetical protein KP509_25G041300 [Ceratopteris richardii]
MHNNFSSVIANPFTVSKTSRYSTLDSIITRPDYSEIKELISTTLLGVLIYACLRVWAHRRAQHYSKDPKTWPILGSHLEASRNYDRLLDWTTSFFDEDHRTVKMTFLARRSYYTVDPANVEHILKTNFQNYPKGVESHRRLFDLLGNGILNTDGETWRMHRKLGSLEFSVKKLRHLTSSVYKKNALKLLERLYGSNEGVDAQELLLDMTFLSICEVVFGSAFNGESDCNTGAGSVAVSLDNAQEMLTRRYLYPWWKINKFLNIGSERIFREDMTKFNNFLLNMIEKRRSQTALTVDYGNDNYPAEQDLLSRFLCSPQPRSNKDALASSIDNEMIKDAMMSFVLAGRDTTASSLSWFLYCMCMHPDKQEKIFEEMINLEKSIAKRNGDSNESHTPLASYTKYDHNDEAVSKIVQGIKTASNDLFGSSSIMLAKKFADEVLTYENLQSSSLPYLHSAIAETLRLYPAVPRDGKVALEADILPDGTHLKAGDQVVYVPYSMGRMPFIWGPDALAFKPERWIHDGRFQPQSPFKLTAFQAGPRMCLGKDAAYLQMKLTAGLLMRFFRFELVPNHPVEYRMMNVMTMKHGLKVNAVAREITQDL